MFYKILYKDRETYEKNVFNMFQQKKNNWNEKKHIKYLFLESTNPIYSFLLHETDSVSKIPLLIYFVYLSSFLVRESQTDPQYCYLCNVSCIFWIYFLQLIIHKKNFIFIES